MILNQIKRKGIVILMRLSEEIKEHLENYKVEDLYLKIYQINQK